MSVEQKKVLITGAAGRLGRLLTKALKQDYELVLVDVLPLTDETGVETHCADVCNEFAMENLCVGVHTVLHLAIRGNICDPRNKLETVNVEGAYCVMRAAARAGCRRVVFASSITIDLLPDNDYGCAKKEVEQWTEIFVQTVPMSVLCLRLGMVISPQHFSIWPGSENLNYVLTHRDMIQQFRSILSHSIHVHYGVFACVSANEPLDFDIEPARQNLGFRPQDNAYLLAHQNARCFKGRLRQLKHGVQCLLNSCRF